MVGLNFHSEKTCWERELLAATLAKTFSFTNIFPQVILLEMIFLYKWIYPGAQQKPSVPWIHWTLPGTFHMQLPKHQWDFATFHLESCTTVAEQNQQVTVCCIGDITTLLTQQSLSGVSWRTARFHSRTCPSSFHPRAPDGMRMCTASLGSWFCASCSCNRSILQMGRPCAFGHFRGTSWRCARPDT